MVCELKHFFFHPEKSHNNFKEWMDPWKSWLLYEQLNNKKIIDIWINFSGAVRIIDLVFYIIFFLPVILLIITVLWYNRWLQ